MSFWAINGLIFLFYSLILNRINKKDLFLLVAFLHLTVIAAFRGIRVGTDTFNYSRDYLKIASGTFRGSPIIPRKSIMLHYFRITSKFLKHRNGYMIATSIPTLAGIFLLIKKYSRSYFLSVYFYLGFFLFFYSLNAGRQMLAISISIVAFVLAKEKKIIASLILFVISVMFHNSTIIFGVYYFLALVQWNLSLFLSYLIGVLVAGGSITFFLRLFIWIFPRYQFVLKTSYLYEWASNGRTSHLITLYCIIAILLSIYWILVNEKKLVIVAKHRRIVGENVYDKETIQNTYELMGMLVIVAVIDGFYPSIILFNRLAYTFFVYAIVLLANAVSNFGRYKTIISFILGIPLFLFVYLLIQGNYSGVLNYSFYPLGR